MFEDACGAPFGAPFFFPGTRPSEFHRTKRFPVNLRNHFSAGEFYDANPASDLAAQNPSSRRE